MSVTTMYFTYAKVVQSVKITADVTVQNCVLESKMGNVNVFYVFQYAFSVFF